MRSPNWIRFFVACLLRKNPIHTTKLVGHRTVGLLSLRLQAFLPFQSNGFLSFALLSLLRSIFLCLAQLLLTLQLALLLQLGFLVPVFSRVDAFADELSLFIRQTLLLPLEPAFRFCKNRAAKQQLLISSAVHPRLQKCSEPFAPEKK